VKEGIFEFEQIQNPKSSSARLQNSEIRGRARPPRAPA
jgi:hypothetical protein